jgi:AraC-like DNA-binding protein
MLAEAYNLYLNAKLQKKEHPNMKPSTLNKYSTPITEWPLLSSRHSGKAKCEKDWNWRPQAIADYDLWYVVSGTGEVWLNGEQYPLTAGSCFLFRPGDHVAAEQHPEQRLTVIFIHFRSGADLESASDSLGLLPSYALVQDTVWMETLLNRLLTLDDSEPDELDNLEFASVLRAALCVAIKAAIEPDHHSSKHHAVIRRLIRLIKENAATSLNHEQLADHAGLSPRYLNTLFKQQTGVSLKTFMARSRVERACHLLAESNMNVTQIAETLGYSDIYFFSKQFKQFVGESPLRYRSRVEAAHSH